MATIPNTVVQFGEFFIEKDITSSAMTTTAATIASTQGNGLLLESITISTDSTGLAGGTNLEISQDSGFGTATFYSTAVAGLGASTTVATGSVTALLPILIPGGNVNIKAKMTVGAGTGAGVAKVLFKFKKLDGGSSAQVV